MSHYTTNLCVCVKGHVVIGIHEFVEEHIKCWISTSKSVIISVVLLEKLFLNNVH